MPDPVTPDPAPSPSGVTPDPAAPVVPPVTPPAVADPAAPPVDPKAAAPVDPAKAAPVIPEKYDFSKVELPKGIELDAGLVEAVSPLLKEFGITQENASKLVAAQVKHLADAETKREADFKTWMAQNVTNYQNDLKKEWGASHDANLTVAQRGMARVVSPAMKALLDETGLGSHPEFVKAFFQVGKMVTEDTPPPGGKPNGKKSNAEVFYGAAASTTN